MSVLLHVPHASSVIPDDVRAAILLDGDALARELLASTDHHTDTFVAGLEQLGEARGVGHGRVQVHVNGHSRLVVDPERFLDPSREATEAVGRGAVYTHGFDGTPLRDTSVPDWPAVRAELIARFFAPYHAHIEQRVADMLDVHGTCTVIDVHSYPREAQPYELAGGLDPAARRPELCIGTDPAHTPERLATGVEAVARALGIAVARDTPFSGTFVPSAFLGDVRVRSVMLEVRRDTYMDEGSGALHGGAVRISELVRRVVEQLLDDVGGVT
jgi:N-formylglutamate deformylase